MSLGDSTQLYTLQSKKSPCTPLLLIPSPNPDPHWSAFFNYSLAFPGVFYKWNHTIHSVEHIIVLFFFIVQCVMSGDRTWRSTKQAEQATPCLGVSPSRALQRSCGPLKGLNSGLHGPCMHHAHAKLRALHKLCRSSHAINITAIESRITYIII